METCGSMQSVEEAGTTRGSSELSRVVKEGCVDDARKADQSQAGHKHAPKSRPRLCVKIAKRGRKPLEVNIVDLFLTK